HPLLGPLIDHGINANMMPKEL
ncbi:MAG: hypothetical protein RL176_1226, partial [Pseudomonadota bacterium]